MSNFNYEELVRNELRTEISEWDKGHDKNIVIMSYARGFSAGNETCRERVQNNWHLLRDAVNADFFNENGIGVCIMRNDFDTLDKVIREYVAYQVYDEIVEGEAEDDE